MAAKLVMNGYPILCPSFMSILTLCACYMKLYVSGYVLFDALINVVEHVLCSINAYEDVMECCAVMTLQFMTSIS